IFAVYGIQQGFYNVVGIDMRAFLLILILSVVMPAALRCATAKAQDCPDAACCLPSSGPSSCSIEKRPCWSNCSRPCPCGIPAPCGRTERYWPVCDVGEPSSIATACYIQDTECTDFLAQYNSCWDPCC